MASFAPPPATFKPGVAAVPATQVEISVSCRNLKDRDTLSKSDPMCVLNAKQFAQDRFVEIGRTEMIKDTLNPDFVKKFQMEYFFEQSQKLLFELYDVDSPSQRLTKHDFLGRLECTLGEIVGSAGNKIEKPLSGLSGKCGSITVRAEEVVNCRESLTIQFGGKKLDKKDFFGKSDPFLVFSRCNEDQTYTVVHRTEVIKNTLNPTWRPFTIHLRTLCNGDQDRAIKIECYDWDSDGSSHDMIGICQTSARDLGKGNSEFELINQKKKAKKKSYKDSGKLQVLMARLETEYTFLDFVQGGLQINFTVAIDFTASNGDPSNSASLHYINPYQPNQYATALQAVGGIIQDYDSDKQFPALGFGARLPPDGRVSHEFFLTGNPQNPFCAGIEGVMAAYQNCIRTVQLYGPTNFAPVINHVAKFARAHQDGSNYFVLLIITDGVITDMPLTTEAIVTASTLPMSIIIVGVGEADFSAMEVLDADDRALKANGRVAQRDIVQFVPFREFIGGKYGANLSVSQAYLAKEVLAEIPGQVTQYMKKNGVKPKAPPPAYGQQQAPVPGNQQPPPPAGYPPPSQGGQTAPPPPAGYPPPSQVGQTAPTAPAW